ncbi:sensor domain-containing protein [Streptomyces sp. NBC_01187]|uniref:sensor domain-containing protein n=1 Tax=Streptomyces sp. NBC_01187 TaxID=2903766 RepID=UPI003865B51E|nr:sensor domain-containing protein [Streptomyces sp. NBC_01187]
MTIHPPTASPPTTPQPRRRSWATVLREPFRAATWRRVAYALLAAPVGILCVPLALVGGPAGRVQRGLARRLLGIEAGEPGKPGEPGRRPALRALTHAVVSLPLNVIAAMVAVYGLSLVLLNVGYPVRDVIGMGDATPATDWGGPTLAGAWTVHLLGGGVAVLALLWIGRGLSALQARLATALLGPARAALWRAVLPALLAAAVGGALSIPVIHQL